MEGVQSQRARYVDLPLVAIGDYVHRTIAIDVADRGLFTALPAEIARPTWQQASVAVPDIQPGARHLDDFGDAITVDIGERQPVVTCLAHVQRAQQLAAAVEDMHLVMKRAA